MATRKRINISIHPIELAKLDRIADEYGETRSGMLMRIILEYPLKKRKDTRDIGELTELSYEMAGLPKNLKCLDALKRKRIRNDERETSDKKRNDGIS